eukprot:9470360-Pyramimonas_sp.AAC.1
MEPRSAVLGVGDACGETRANCGGGRKGKRRGGRMKEGKGTWGAARSLQNEDPTPEDGWENVARG